MSNGRIVNIVCFKVLTLIDRNQLNKQLILKIDYLCIHLIHLGQPESAMLIYEALVDPIPEKKYGHFLLREMIIANTVSF